jgi:hypothetical protein
MPEIMDPKEFAAIERQKQALLAKPAAMADWVGKSLQENFGPELKKPKKGYATALEGVDAATPNDHPFKGMGPALYRGVNAAMRDPATQGYTAEEILGNLASTYALQANTGPEPFGDKAARWFGMGTPVRSGETRLEAAYRYKRAKEAPLWGEPTETVKAPPLYDKWLQEQRKLETEQTVPYTHESYLDNVITAGRRGAVLGAALGAVAGPEMVPAGALTLGIASAATEVVADPFRRWLHGTEWYKAKASSPSMWDKGKALAAAQLPDLGAFVGFEKLTRMALGNTAVIDKASGLMRDPYAQNVIEAADLKKWALRNEMKITTALEDEIDRGVVWDAVNNAQRNLTQYVSEQRMGRSAEIARMSDYYKAPTAAEENLPGFIDTLPTSNLDPYGRLIEHQITAQKIAGMAPLTTKEMFEGLSQQGAEEVLTRSENGVALDSAVSSVAPGDRAVKNNVEREVAKGWLKAPDFLTEKAAAAKIQEWKDLGLTFAQARKKRVKAAPKIASATKDASEFTEEDVATMLQQDAETEVPSIIKQHWGMPGDEVILQDNQGRLLDRLRVLQDNKALTEAEKHAGNLETLRGIGAPEDVLKGMGPQDSTQTLKDLNDFYDHLNSLPRKDELGETPFGEAALAPEKGAGKDPFSYLDKMSPADLVAEHRSIVEFLKTAPAGTPVEKINRLNTLAREVTKRIKNPFTLGIAGLVGVGTALASLGHVDEAQAGVADKLVGSVGKYMLPFLKSSVEVGTEVKTLLQAVDKLGLTLKPVAEGATELPVRMNGLPIGESAGSTFATMDQTVRSTKSLPFLPMRMQSMWSLAKTLYKEGWSPTVEAVSRQIATTGNTENAMKVFDNILKEVPEAYAEGSAATREIVDAMAPLAEKWQNVMVYQALSFKEGIARSLIDSSEKFPEKFLKGPKVKKLQNAVNDLPKYQDAMAQMKPMVDEAMAEVTPIYQQLASRFSRARISLAAEDTADFQYYPWLQSMMTWDEKVAVSKIKGMMDNYKTAMKDIGQDTIEARPYMQHSFHPSWTEKNMEQRMKELDLGISDALPFSKFFERSKYSTQMVPDIGFNMSRYIPDTERRLQTIPFWDAWSGHMNSPLVKGSEPLGYMWRTIRNNMLPITNTTATQWANRYTAFEAIRLLGINPGTGFKHLLKGTATMASLGIGPTASTLGASTMAALRSYGRESIDRGFLGMLGMKDLSVEAKDIDQFLKPFIGLNRMNQIVQDLNLNPYAQKEVDSWMQKIAQKGSLPTGFAETIDRANTVLASLLMADKAGLTPQQAMYGIYSNILQNNFVGGVANASWMRNPGVRAAMMFQTTAYKILERRVLLATRTGQAIKEAWNIPGATTGDKLQQLFGLKNAMREGDRTFKSEMIMNSLKADKDIFGTPLSKQFMRELFMVGLGLTAGSAVGLDLSPQFLHVPFMKMTNSDPVIGVSPIVAAMTKTAGDRHKAEVAGDEPEFVVSSFMQNWLGRTGYMPLLANKMLRLSDDDIPEMYRDSGLRYLFSVPATKE